MICGPSQLWLCDCQQCICIYNLWILYSPISSCFSTKWSLSCPLILHPDCRSKQSVCVCVWGSLHGHMFVWIPWSAAPPPQTHNCWSYQLGPLISVISLAVGNKGLICADGLQPTRPLGPFTFTDKFVSSLIIHINHVAQRGIQLFAVALRPVISIGGKGVCGKTDRETTYTHTHWDAEWPFNGHAKYF